MTPSRPTHLAACAAMAISSLAATLSADTVSFVTPDVITYDGPTAEFDSDEGVEVVLEALTSAPNGGNTPNENAPFPGGLSPVIDALVSGPLGLGVQLPGDDTVQIDGGGLDEVVQITFPVPVTILSIAFGLATGNDTFDIGVSPTTNVADAVDVAVIGTFGSDNFVAIAATPRGATNPFIGVTVDFEPGVEINDGDPNGPVVPLRGRTFYVYTNQDSNPRDDYSLVSIEFIIPEPMTISLVGLAAIVPVVRRRRRV